LTRLVTPPRWEDNRVDTKVELKGVLQPGKRNKGSVVKVGFELKSSNQSAAAREK
jgi:hypothetical protein